MSDALPTLTAQQARDWLNAGPLTVIPQHTLMEYGMPMKPASMLVRVPRSMAGKARYFKFSNG